MPGANSTMARTQRLSATLLLAGLLSAPPLYSAESVPKSVFAIFGGTKSPFHVKVQRQTFALTREDVKNDIHLRGIRMRHAKDASIRNNPLATDATHPFHRRRRSSSKPRNHVSSGGDPTIDALSHAKHTKWQTSLPWRGGVNGAISMHREIRHRRHKVGTTMAPTPHVHSQTFLFDIICNKYYLAF